MIIDEIIVWRPSGDVTAIGHLASRILLHRRDDLELIADNINYETGSETIFTPSMKPNLRGGREYLALGPPIDDHIPKAGDVVIKVLNDSDVYAYDFTAKRLTDEN